MKFNNNMRSAEFNEPEQLSEPEIDDQYFDVKPEIEMPPREEP